jgi:hypothetical protein
MELNTFNAYLKLDLVCGKDIIKMSLQLLEEGYESTTIACLAGERDIEYIEGKKQFCQFLKEISVELNDDLTSKKFVLKDQFSIIAKDESKIDDVMTFILKKIQDSTFDKKMIGDYLSIEEIIGNYYEIEDVQNGSIPLSDEERKKLYIELKENLISNVKKYIENN